MRSVVNIIVCPWDRIVPCKLSMGSGIKSLAEKSIHVCGISRY